MSTVNPIRGWGVYSADPRRLSRFYSQVFSWDIHPQDIIHGPGPRPASDSGPYAVVASHVPGDIHGSIAPDTLTVSFTVDARPFTGVVIYVYVDDIHERCRAAEAAGGTLRIPPTQIGDRGYVAMFLDPDGNGFFMWQPPEGWQGDHWSRARGL